MNIQLKTFKKTFILICMFGYLLYSIDTNWISVFFAWYFDLFWVSTHCYSCTPNLVGVCVEEKRWDIETQRESGAEKMESYAPLATGSDRFECVSAKSVVRGPVGNGEWFTERACFLYQPACTVICGDIHTHKCEVKCVKESKMANLCGFERMRISEDTVNGRVGRHCVWLWNII